MQYCVYCGMLIDLVYDEDHFKKDKNGKTECQKREEERDARRKALEGKK